jgi:carbon-monoxide dehydrogenase medium subunit
MKETIYLAPKNAEEALRNLAEHGPRAAILAGGTDLVPRIHYRELYPEVLLYIGGIALRYIKHEKGKTLIGAGTTWKDLIAHPLIHQYAPVLAEAAKLGGCVATRNAATIGGNLANASPAADLATPLLVLDAELLLQTARGERVVPLKDFFIGPGKTLCKTDEMISEIQIPFSKGKSQFFKLGRRKAMTLSVVNGAVWMAVENGKCREVRIALGAVAPTPIRCFKAEAMVKGKKLDSALIADCGQAAMAESQPIDDQRSSAWYRKKVGEALLSKAMKEMANL